METTFRGSKLFTAFIFLDYSAKSFNKKNNALTVSIMNDLHVDRFHCHMHMLVEVNMSFANKTAQRFPRVCVCAVYFALLCAHLHRGGLWFTLIKLMTV